MESEVTIELLRSIRDEIVHVATRVDATNERLDTTNSRLERLERRQVEMEVRLTTELVAVTGAINTLNETFKADRGVRVTVRDHEKRITALEKRAPRR